MDLTTALSDDQIAIMGCFAALSVCGVIAAVTFQFGAAGRQRQDTPPQSVPLSRTQREAAPQQPRRAA